MWGGELDPVRVVIGALDDLSLADAKRWLRAHLFSAGLALEVDLAGLGHAHHGALLALLVETDARARAAGTRVIVLHPPGSMVAALTTTNVHIRRRIAGVAVPPPRQRSFPAPTHRWAASGQRPEHDHVSLGGADSHQASSDR